MNKILPTVTLLGVLAGAFALSGCVLASSSMPAKHGTTLGQELIDLQKARDSGALTETEYQAQREKLVGTHK